MNVQNRTSNGRQLMESQTYDLEKRRLKYSVSIIKTVEQLPNTITGNHIAGLLLRSAASASLNRDRSQSAESPIDFQTSLKELRETQRWLNLLMEAPLIKKKELLNNTLEETEQLTKIFVTSIKTAEMRRKK